MDITQLKYFVCIVESEYNLSAASKKLHISQPALTQYIRKFEDEEGIELFTRMSSRLNGLTVSGENFYSNAKIVIEQYNTMYKELHENSSSIKGTVTIGIPPLVLTVLFTDYLSQIIRLNPTIRFNIIEEGAYELRRKLLLHEIDFVVILQPTNLNNQIYAEDIIHKDQLTAFMCSKNKLSDKQRIDWKDLDHANLAIFNESFMIHHQLMKKFESEDIKPNIVLSSSLWDFLLESTRSSDYITILPAPIHNHIRFDGIVEKQFNQPIYWHVVLAYPIKTHYNRIERYVRRSMHEFFLENKELKPINESE